jgi:murein peptide amidase A
MRYSVSIFFLTMLFLQEIIQSTAFADEIPEYYFSIGRTQQQRELIVEQFGLGAERIVLVASLHGTETIGTPLCNQLIDELHKHPEWLDGKTVYIVRMANPDGVVEGIRGNRDNIDINRNFPTDNFGRGWFNGEEPLSAHETVVLMKFFSEVEPHRVLTIHQPLNGIDYDGPADDLALYLSELSDIRIHRLGSRSGSLGSFVGKELNIPIVTLEIPASAQHRSGVWLWDKYGVIFQGFLEYDASNRQSD